MTYDIFCYKPITNLPSVDEAKSILESDEVETNAETPEEEADRQWRIVVALMKYNPKLEPFGFEFARTANSKEAQRKIGNVELNTPPGEPSIQISIYPDQAAIAIPYWYEGSEADQAFSTASAYLRIIGKAAGYFVYDPQTEMAFDPTRSELGGISLYKGMTKRLPGWVSDLAKNRDTSQPT